jgi:hypothetical protein
MLTHLRARRHRGAVIFTLVCGIALLITGPAAPALAVYPILTTPLTGPAINGVVPTGQAEVNQCKLPKQFGTLTMTVQSVNLPDRTELTVNYGGSTLGQGVNVGSFALSGGAGRLSTNLGTMAGANDNIAVMQGSTILLSNPARWAASYNCHG